MKTTIANTSTHMSRPRRGASAVEFAFIAPVMFILIFGVIEFSRVVMVHHTLTDGVRDAAREASLPTMKSASTVESNLRSRLSASIPAASGGNAVAITVLPSDLSAAKSGDSVRVKVAVNYSNVSWLPAIGFRSVAANTRLSAEATMERE
jgi:Flp pilus assembly protein TadG